MTVRVLDIDLDFFLNGTCWPAEKGKRPAPDEATPWPEDKMRDFLENHLHLSRERRVPGKIVETHDMVLPLWQRISEKPFQVTHIDAHSDLGIGRPGPAYVLESVITRPPETRGDIARYYAEGKLDEANYLLFALAFRWISSLDNVRNPASRPDMPPFCREGALRLESSVGRLVPALNHNEPEIPFFVYPDPVQFFAQAPYDIATLAISPRYAPETADCLTEVFMEYIVE